MDQRHCPACGAALSSEQGSEGLCLACLFELALESPSLLAELDDEGDETLAFPGGTFVPGAILGERYRVRALLGRGGMGEVWRAFDLKLRVDVALKAVLPKWIENERTLETLRQEVRSARQVMSPNVCRIFDLIEIDGRELVSMEYVDGTTLLDILRMRAPLELTEAREIASQFLAGLEAIHDAGLVHRDVKPENIMMTRSGRVVVMDFGIAKALAPGRGGTVAGTPAYMPPEQARGDTVTSRTDVFSAAVVLAEMVAPAGLRTAGLRRKVWEGARREPPEVGDTPWAPVLAKALAQVPEERHRSASALARALEEVTLRAAGDDDLHPYPGLSSFTEKDAEYFFGRELEVEEMWKKLQRPHLLGLIGPSGAGKSSFLRAGLLPTVPTGWRAIVTTPGDRPFVALGQALADELVGDQEALRELPRIAEPDVAVTLVERWRRRHDEALLIVDQFEELFTQNPGEIQRRFPDLLGRLALEADVHVLLSMRDDFLFHCSEQPALAPMYSELSPLRPPAGAAVRRALVQPALKCGYRFEDEDLVDEMVAEVGSERGALPLLAFAAARLWDLRDRERGLLTREAYEHIGGVGGALAQHAEATLERVGPDRVSVVRELFRNLVTAQGTRAVRDSDELLSVFPPEERDTVGSVLDTLVDARLLVSYEAEEDEDLDRRPSERRRIEIVHESLLSKWPRLVRWRMQNEEGAQLRDQLRQAARLWHERDRPDDLLWTGTSFKEYELWRERYAGGLSAAEEEFARAMSSRAARRRRRRRFAVAAVLAVAIAVAAVTSSLWRRSESAREQATVAEEQSRHEARRAEAQKLLALGQLELETMPTGALAYATASLELADTPDARLFALRALAAGPPATVLPMEEGMDRVHDVVFSPDASWAALCGFESLQVVSRDGRVHRSLEPFPSGSLRLVSAFGPSGDVLFGAKDDELRAWSVPDFELVDRRPLPDGRTWSLEATPIGVIAITDVDGEQVVTANSVGEQPSVLGRVQARLFRVAVDPSGRWLAWAEGPELFVRPLADPTSPARRLGALRDDIASMVIDPSGERIAVIAGGEASIWPTRPDGQEPSSGLEGPSVDWLAFGPEGRRIAGTTAESKHLALWDLGAPPEVTSYTFSWALPGVADGTVNGLTVAPGGRWLATGNVNVAGFWPLARREPRVFVGHEGWVLDVKFTPDGTRLVSIDFPGEVREWSLRPGGSGRILARVDGTYHKLDVDAGGRLLAVSRRGGALVISLDGGSTRRLDGFDPRTWVWPVALDPAGRLVAAASLRGSTSDKVIRIWDLETGESRILGPTDDAGEGFEGQIAGLAFLPDGSLASAGHGGLRLWSPGTGHHEVIAPSFEQSLLAPFDEGRFVAHSTGTLEASSLAITDLETGTTRQLPSHGEDVWPIAVDPTGAVVVTGGLDGVVRVGPVNGEEPHLQFGHEGWVHAVAVSPDGRWIASGGADHTIRLWPMPDLSQPPLHTLPHAELVAKLRSLTNVRVVRDPQASTGWKKEVFPFPGWQETPDW